MDEEEENRRRVQLVGVYMTIPFVLAIPPIMGWLIGGWLDKLLGVSPYLMYGLLILGFVAGIRELYRIIKKYGNNGN